MFSFAKIRAHSWLLPLFVLFLMAGCEETAPLYQARSEFNQIIVQQDGQGIRRLRFSEDGAVQSALDTADPEKLVIAYTRAAMTALAAVPKPQRLLIIGLGGGSMPAFLRRNYPEAIIDIAELDPAVARVAREFFSFREDDRMKVHIGDGRKFIENSKDKYDLIFLDAFGEDSVPFSLATIEFFEKVRDRLAPSGLAVSNLWADPPNNLYGSMLKTHAAAFGHVHVIAVENSSNRIILAHNAKDPLDQKTLLAQAKKLRLRPQLDLAAMIDSGWRKHDLRDAAGKVLRDADPDRRP